MKKYSLLLLGFILLFSCNKKTDENNLNSHTEAYPEAYDYKSLKEMNPEKAAVVTAHPLASAVGLDILQQGGNAIDASVAVQYALAVVFPEAGNIGGGGFLLFHSKDGDSYSIDFREAAPQAAHRDMYLDENREIIPNKSLDGHWAVGIPGTVAGIYLSHEKFGKLPMEKLIQPAIQIAEYGFAITELEANKLNEYAEQFHKLNTIPNAFTVKKNWKAGDTLIQTDLANTLKRIQKNGEKEFYEGETAKLIVEEMRRGSGLINLDDLKSYQAKFRNPIKFDYKDTEVLTMNLPSSGGLMLQQMLKMLEPYNISEMGFHDPLAIQHIVEVERRSYADRSEYIGDPDFVDVPVDALLDEAYILSRMTDFEPAKAGVSEKIKPGLDFVESEETTHFSILDAEGNAVAVTTTLNTNYGSKVVVGEAGFFLNNEMDDFSAKPGAPNAFGLLGNEANQIEPNKRMVSSMTPTIVLRDKKPYIVVGTPGGSTIITSVLQAIINIMEFDLSANDAINTAKFHHQWMPDVITLENDFPKDVAEKLDEMGYKLNYRDAIGRTEIIVRDADGKIQAVADKRGDDSVAGY